MTIQTMRTTRTYVQFGLWVLLIGVAAFGVSTSAQVRRTGNSVGVTVYVNPNFSGQSASFRDDTPNLVPLGLNDKISSIQIPNGETWEVCQDINYGNQCQVLSSSVSDLRGMGWSDRISSLRRIGNGYNNGGNNNGGYNNGGYNNAPAAQQGLIFYNQSGYRGTSTLVTNGSSNTGFSARQGSVQLRGSGPWEVCDNSSRCATISQDVSNLSQLGLTGRITSVRSLNDDRRNPGRGRGRGRGRGNDGTRFYRQP